MKLKVQKKALQTVLTRVGTVASTKSPLHALTCVLLDATKDRVTLTTSDTFMAAVENVPGASVSEPGTIALPCRQLIQLVSAMPDGEIALNTKGTTAELKSGSRKLKLEGIDGNDFPKIGDWTPTRSFEVKPEFFARLLRRVEHASGTNLDRAYLNGIAVFTDRGLNATATDGHCVAWATEEFDGGDFELTIVPIKAVRTICELCDSAGEDEMLGIATDGNRISATFSWGRVDAAVPNGSFPPMLRFLPKEEECTYCAPSLDATRLADSVAALSNAGDEGKETAVCIEANGSIKVSVNGKASQGTDELECEAIGNLKVLASARSLLNALRCGADKDGRVKFLGAGELDPLLIKSPGFLGLVMPRRPGP